MANVNVLKTFDPTKIIGKKIKSMTLVPCFVGLYAYWEMEFQDGLKLYFDYHIFNADAEKLPVK